jgi:glycosyltransferase involved in cell wall biosynthesis
MKEIFIIIPTYNEEENILQLINKIRTNIPISTICIVDDSIESKIKKLLKKKKLKKFFIFTEKIQKGVVQQ